MQLIEEKCVAHNDMQTFLLEPDSASIQSCLAYFCRKHQVTILQHVSD